MLIPSILLAATSPIDVAIPGVIGLLLVAFPQFAFKKSGSPDVDSGRMAKARMLGGVLLVVAGAYSCIMFAQP